MSYETTIIENQKVIIQQNDFLIKMLKAVLPDAGKNLWMNEDEVLVKLNTSSSTLKRKRRNGELEWRYAGNGRKIQYNRKSVEADLQKRSTVQPGRLKIA